MKQALCTQVMATLPVGSVFVAQRPQHDKGSGCGPAPYHKVWGTIIETLCAHFGEVAVCPDNKLGMNWRLPMVKMQSDSIFSFCIALHLRASRSISKLFGANLSYEENPV